LDHVELERFEAVRSDYPVSNPDKVSGPNDLAYVIYTSGTTGNPKGVMIEHTSNINMSLDQIKFIGVTKKDKITWFASVSFDASIYEIMMGLYCGATLYIPAEETIKDKDRFIRFLKDSESTVLTLPPSYLGLLPTEDIIGLRCLITAGESPNIPKILEIAESGIQHFNAYGPTECAVCVTIYKTIINDFKKEKNVLIPIGRPISNTQVYLLDGMLEPVGIGVQGRLYVSGSGLARGYLNKPELTAEKFIDNPFLEGERIYDTGDLGRWLPDGNIEFLGRDDHQVKVRGYRIELEEIESTLIQYRQGLKQVVVEAKDHDKDKVLVAYYTSSLAIDKESLKNFLQDRLPDYMVPSFYVELEELPLTSNGKIDRKLLSNSGVKKDGNNPYIPPKNKIEKELVMLWQNVLGIEKIGVRDNFFDLGGNSLHIMRLLSMTNNHFSVQLRIEDFFHDVNIEKIAETINELQSISIIQERKSKQII